MKKTDQIITIATLLLSFISGITIWILKDYFPIEDTFGTLPNPKIEYFKIIHHFSTVGVVFALGFIFKDHMIRKYKMKGLKKKTGLALIIFLTLSALTGQSMLSISSDELLHLIQDLHLIIGLCSVGIFLVHYKLRHRS